MLELYNNQIILVSSSQKESVSIVKVGVGLMVEKKILKALCNPVRIEILHFLTKGPSCVTLTNQEIDISQPNLSQHLKVLKDAGIVDSKKVMTKRCYFIKKPEEVKKILALLQTL